MRSGLAETWQSRVSDQAEESAERLAAEANLARPESLADVLAMLASPCHMLPQAVSLSRQGKYAEAELIERDLHGVLMRVLGAEHPNTLATAANLADSLTGQGACARLRVRACARVYVCVCVCDPI
jgi:prophage DNA circulation protein